MVKLKQVVRFLLSPLAIGLIVSIRASCDQSAWPSTPTPTTKPIATHSPAPTQVPTTKPAAPVRLRHATGPAGWSMYTYAIKMAQVLDRYSNLKVTVESTSGTNVAIESVATGLKNMAGPIDISAITAAYLGVGVWKTPNKNLRVLISVGGLYRSYVTTLSSGIKSILDLKGKRIPRYVQDRDTWGAYDAIMRAYGLDPRKDVKELQMQGGLQARDELVMGRLSKEELWPVFV